MANVQQNLHRAINGLIKSAPISTTLSGKYFISILIETIANPLPKTYSNIGIDLSMLANNKGQIIKHCKSLIE